MEIIKVRWLHLALFGVVFIIVGGFVYSSVTAEEPMLIGLGQDQFHRVIAVDAVNESFTRKYLNAFSDFTHLDYKSILETDSNHQDTLKVGSQHFAKPVGYMVDNKRLVVDLLVCDEETQSCAFRINGIPTKRIYMHDDFLAGKKSEFRINEDLKLKIVDVLFGYCHGKRFCDLYFDAYDQVVIELMRV